MSRVHVDGVEIAYDDEGCGEPLLLVHGHPFDRSMWRPQIAAFRERGWRVLAPDLRGYGESGAATGKTPLARFARDLEGLLDRLALDQVVLGGLSMGGQIALELCRRAPQRLRGLLLSSTSPHPENPAGRQLRLVTADRLLREGMAGYAQELLPKMLAARTLRERPQVARHVLGMMRGAPAEGAAAALRGRAERPDYAGTLPGIRVPTLVVVGEHDEYAPVDEVRAWQALVPGARLAVIEGAGHLPNLERPAEFNAALAGLLTEVAVPAGEGAGLTRPRS